jgi:hypothetical protein
MGRSVEVAAILALASAVALAGGRARAASDENPAVGRISLLNREAIEAYRSLDFAQAQRLLDQALDLAVTAGLTQHPVRARTYATLGAVTAGGLKRQDVAVRLFRKALQIQPEIELSKELATPEVQAAFDEAVKGLASEPKVERPPSELLVHEPVSAATRGDAITIAATPDDSLLADRLLVAYRPTGAATFAKVDMQRQSDGVFEGVIPAPATSGREVAYYIEARDLDGKLVSARGSAVAPMIIALSGPAPAAAAAATAAAATPVVVRPAEPPRRNDGRKILIGLLTGTGVGWTCGTGEVTGYSVGTAGFAWARIVHLVPEVGYFVTPRLLLAVAGRLQLLQGNSEYRPPEATPDQCGGDGVCSPARGAFAAFAKAAWFFAGPEAALRPYVSLAVGGGDVRHVVKVESNNDCGADQQQECLDTVAAGPFLVGPGAGLLYRLTPVVQLVAAVDGLLGAPRFTAHADVNVGLALAL